MSSVRDCAPPTVPSRTDMERSCGRSQGWAQGLASWGGDLLQRWPSIMKSRDGEDDAGAARVSVRVWSAF